MKNNHSLREKYQSVWEKTLSHGSLAEEAVAGSKVFFESDAVGKIILRNEKPTPKRFDTYGIVCCLPFPEEFQKTLDNLWQSFMLKLGNPLAYGVGPANRHVEIFLFQRPEEIFAEEIVKNNIYSSTETAAGTPPFKIRFEYPFITPDGTIVVPGYDEPAGTVESLRDSLKSNLKDFPKKQSQWLHTSLGRILEPLDSERLAPLISDMKSRFGETIGTVEVKELIWTHEKQWYMVDKTILHHTQLKKEI